MRCCLLIGISIVLGVVASTTSGCNRKKTGDAAPDADATLVVSAGLQSVAPESEANSTRSNVDYGAFEVPRVHSYYEFTTPADAPIRLHLISRSDTNTGEVRVEFVHASDDGEQPALGGDSLIEAGLRISGNGSQSRDGWLGANGNGFSRVTLRGTIQEDQVLLVRAKTEDGEQVARVDLRIGPPSIINLPPNSPTLPPNVLSEEEIYSSNSWQAAQPVVARSGDRSTVILYEGDGFDPQSSSRFKMRLQQDDNTGAITGGASVELADDTGNWRDHEVAALYNVIAAAQTTSEFGNARVDVEISYDRGATFETINLWSDDTFSTAARLVQIAMAADYSTAVTFWRPSDDAFPELVLYEGRPDAYDTTGSPSSFTFDPPVVIHSPDTSSVPQIMGIAYSEAGDLVIGYSYTTFTGILGPVLSWFRCATRLYGEEFVDTEVDFREVIPMDPSVAVIGGGPDLQIFYAYELPEGVALATSADAGVTFSAPISLGTGGANTPSVHARLQDGLRRVDCLYIADGDFGRELHNAHWDDFGAGPPEIQAITTSTMEPSELYAPGISPGTIGTPINPDDLRIRELSWLGYDATLDGDDVVVAALEEFYDTSAWIVWSPPVQPATGGGFAAAPAIFVPSAPPPLAPGLTEPVADPDPNHLRHLKLIRLD